MSQSPFGDIPLFRELQRLLASSGEGPINLEIASQIATSIATQGGPSELTRARGTALAEAVHDAETVLAGFTRLSLTEPISSEAVNPVGWANKTLNAWRWLFERLGKRLMEELTDDEVAGGGDQMQLVMGQIGPLLLGLQVGTLVGHLSREATGTYDPSIPRRGESGILVVVPNLDRIAGDYSLDRALVLRWAALHETSRHLVVQAISWVDPYRRSLVEALVDAIEIDMSELQRRLLDIQAGGLDALGDDEVDGSVPLVPTERHRLALERVRAFVALHAGYASHAAKAVAPDLLGESSKVDEAMVRHTAGPSEAKEMLGSLLGFSLEKDLVATGQGFCAAVTGLEGHTALNRVWEAPDNLPTYKELRDPFGWIDRVVKER